MLSVDEVFTELVGLVEAAASHHGFIPTVEPADPGVFDDRRIRFRRGAQEVRLVWDGREQWFTFAYVPEPDRTPALEWTGLLSERCSGANIADGDLDRLRASLEMRVRKIWPGSAPASIAQ
jgi:hypothetical protein